MSDDKKLRQDRRNFLKGVSAIATAGAASSLGATETPGGESAEPAPRSGRTMIDYAAPGLERVRFGVIGTGERGSTLLRLLLQIPDADVIAVCDTDPLSLANAKSVIADAGRGGNAKSRGGSWRWRHTAGNDNDKQGQ